MELFRLLLHLEHDVVQGTTGREIRKVTNDTRKIEAGDLFVCIKGYQMDGHNMVDEAIRKGAVAIVSEDETVKLQAKVPKDITIIKVENTRYALSILVAASYGYPAKSLKIIGITGTKGKTTVACMLHQILNGLGHRTGLIGTIQIDTGANVYKNCNTTPDSLDIQRYLYEMKESGCEYAVVEVSSQGLKLHRTAGISFEIGIFTNLEEDHIGPDEHADFDEYLSCKKMLFERCKVGIGNIDDLYYPRMFENTGYKKYTYSTKQVRADFYADAIQMVTVEHAFGIQYICKEKQNEYEIRLPIAGEFNVYNSLAVIAALRYLQFSYEQIITKMSCVKIAGRLEKVGEINDCMLYIDYAHNGMSLRSVLKTLREYRPERIVAIFGCGGNRARERRFSMGKAAGEYADFTIITTDNPRFEAPDQIIKDIEKGIKKTKGDYRIIPDRKEAIRFAIENRRAGDVILIAGKGHETYQEIAGTRYEMDDRELVREIEKVTECTQM